jgi:hypothetical protein
LKHRRELWDRDLDNLVARIGAERLWQALDRAPALVAAE